MIHGRHGGLSISGYSITYARFSLDATKYIAILDGKKIKYTSIQLML